MLSDLNLMNSSLPVEVIGFGMVFPQSSSLIKAESALTPSRIESQSKLHTYNNQSKRII